VRAEGNDRNLVEELASQISAMKRTIDGGGGTPGIPMIEPDPRAIGYARDEEDTLQ
jgi:hypothetical protein